MPDVDCDNKNKDDSTQKATELTKTVSGNKKIVSNQLHFLLKHLNVPKMKLQGEKNEVSNKNNGTKSPKNLTVFVRLHKIT